MGIELALNVLKRVLENNIEINSTWNCSKKCPVGTYAETINNTCVKQCPTNYFGYQ